MWILSSLAVAFVCGTTLLWSSGVRDRPGEGLASGGGGGGGGGGGVIPKKPRRRTTKNVFCYGDSLTAGTSPPEREKYPYGKYLEDALRGSDPGDPPAASVRWLGRPGWTAPALLTKIDLGEVLREAAADIDGGDADDDADDDDADHPPFDLVIVLAGTNDLGYAGEAGPIIEAVEAIHAVAHGSGCPTVALGIPPSGYQSRSETARALASSVNEAPELWASSDDLATYVPYPIREFDPTNGDGWWSFDGLHFSPEGYRFVAESLAPIVAELLN